MVIDEVRVRQIIFNLLSNAIKFTLEGSIDVRITTSTQQENKTNLIIEVEDTGIGMDEEQQEHMFEAFSQHSNQNNKEYGGTGLGLAIAKKLVELMDGNIILKSKRDIGTSFIVTLNDIEMSNGELKHRSLKSVEVIFEEATVLVADDIFLNRELIKEYLKDTKLKLLLAVDGQEAVDMARKNKIDLVLMDIKMPNKNGYEATLEIKRFKDIPVIAITASVISRKENKENRIFDDFLHKPVNRDELILSISEYLKCEIITETTKEELTQDLSNISLKEYPDLYELLESAKSNGDIELIQEFADELDRYGEKNSIASFKTLSTQISSAVSSFDIGECEVLLSRFYI